MLVVAAEPLFVCLFVTWHLTSWQRCRVPKRRAGVDVIDLLGRIGPRPIRNAPIVFLLRGTCSVYACSSLCTSLDNQVSFNLNRNVKYLHVVYKYALCPYSAFSPLLSFSINAAVAAKLCIECISKDRPQSGCMLAWLKQVWYLLWGVGLLEYCFNHHYSDMDSVILCWFIRHELKTDSYQSVSVLWKSGA